MAVPLFTFFVVGAAALSLVCARTWHTAALLALVELSWVALCGIFGATLFSTGDLFCLAWACVMLFFSAVELVLSVVLFATTAKAGLK